MHETVGNERQAQPAGWFPWRYLVPRKNYRRHLRIAREFPQLRPYIDRDACLRGASALCEIPAVAMLVLALPFVIVGILGLAISQVMTGVVRLPGSSLQDRITENAIAANRTVGPEEVSRRLEGC